MNFETIRGKALDRVPLTFDEALWLYETVPPARLFRLADALRCSGRARYRDLADRPQRQHHQRLHLGL